jgi:hypothetical protein
VLGGFASLKECSCFVQTASVPIFLLIRWPSLRVSSVRSSAVIPGPQFIAAKSEAVGPVWVNCSHFACCCVASPVC